MVAGGVQENDSKIQNEEHDHVRTSRRVLLVDTSGDPYTASGATYSNKTHVTTGKILLVTPATPVQGTTQTVPDGIKAKFKASEKLNDGVTDFTGKIYVKGTALEANAFYLFATQEVELLISNINVIWIDSDTAGAVLTWIIEY